MTLRRPAVVLIAAALIAAAFVLRLTQPSDEQQQAPFVTAAGFGQEVAGRDLTFVAQDAYLADRLTSSSWVGETAGIWLVVDATIGSKLGVAVPYATVTIGDLRYTSSDRPEDVVLEHAIDAGLPQRGSFAFELPLSVLDGPDATHAVVRFATAYEVRLDSAIDLTLDLTALEHRASSALQRPGLVLP
jgi:hypothetical protein